MSKENKFYSILTKIMPFSISIPLVLGSIIVIFNENIGGYVMLSSLLVFYIEVCIICLFETYKESKKKFLLLIIVTIILVIIGLIFKYKGSNEKKEQVKVLNVSESTITVKYDNIDMNVSKPFLENIKVGEYIYLYYNDTIDNARLLSYSNVGMNSLMIGLIFPFVGGMFIHFIPMMIKVMIKDMKKGKKYGKKK